MQDEYFIIGKIVAKYPELNDLTPEERSIWDEWMAKEESREMLQSIVDSKESALRRMMVIKETMNESIQKYYEAIEGGQPKKTIWWNSWKTYVAAASIMIAVLAGVLFLMRRNENSIAKTEEKPMPVVHDVAPGQFKAKLTLADGSTIVLDSFNKDQLIQQGNTVIRNKDGKLFYEQKGKTKEVLYNILTTGKGETFGTVLPDGSKVWLNSESSIRFQVSVTGDQQQIEVTGEAYFDIVHNPKRQLNIKVEGFNIEDIGTQFNVNAYEDEESIRTTLVGGAVRVGKGDRQVIVKSGQQAILSFDKLKTGSAQHDNPWTTLRVTKDVDVDKAVAWRYGYFQFNEDNLQTVLRQIVRWYDVDIVYKGDIPVKTFWGKMSRSNSLSHVLETLETNGVHFKIEGKKIIVSK